MQMNHPILEGMARAAWVAAWASAEEEAGRGGDLIGGDLDQLAPEAPNDAWFDAGRLIGHLEAVNGVGVWTLYHRACEAIVKAEEAAAPSLFDFLEVRHKQLMADADLARHFGSDLMLEAVGHGVSWFDDKPAFDLTMPRVFDVEATVEAAAALAAESLAWERPTHPPHGCEM